MFFNDIAEKFKLLPTLGKQMLKTAESQATAKRLETQLAEVQKPKLELSQEPSFGGFFGDIAKQFNLAQPQEFVKPSQEKPQSFVDPVKAKEAGDRLRTTLTEIARTFPREGAGAVIETIEKFSGIPSGSVSITPGAGEVFPKEKYGELGPKVEKFLFGDKPVESLTKQGEEVLRGFGVPEDSSKKFGLTTGLVFLGLDLLPPGGKDVLKLFAKANKVDDVKKIAFGIKGIDNAKITDEWAGAVAKTTDVNEIKKLVDEVSITPKAEPIKPEATPKDEIDAILSGKTPLRPPVGLKEDYKQILGAGAYMRVFKGGKYAMTADEMADKLKMTENQFMEELDRRIRASGGATGISGRQPMSKNLRMQKEFETFRDASPPKKVDLMVSLRKLIEESGGINAPTILQDVNEIGGYHFENIERLKQAISEPSTPQRIRATDKELGLIKREQTRNLAKQQKEAMANLKRGREQKPSLITRSEDVLLRERIRAEVRGAKEATQAVRTIVQTSRGKAYEEALAELSDATKKAVQILKDKTTNIAQKKQLITDYAKAKLSLDLRGRLLSAVNKATTEGDVANAIRRVNVLRNEEMKKELVSDIETAFEKIDALPPNQQKKALETIEGLTDETFSKKTQAKLQELKEFISKEPEAVYRFGAKTLKKAEQATELGKTKLEDVPIRNLIKINDRLDYLLKEGKLAEKTTEEIKTLKVQNALKEITDSKPRNLDEGLPPPRKPGEPVSIGKFAGARDSTIEAMRKGTQYYVTPDVGFQIFDNEKTFGATWRIFKRPVDVATDLENEMRNEIIDNLFIRLKTIETKSGKLATENYENVMLHATIQQEGGRAKLMKSDPRVFTEAFLDNVKLTEGEMEFYKLGREIFDELRPNIERVLYATRGEKLGKVDNYWSWITDFDNSDELFMRLSGDYKLASRTEQGFTKSRTIAGAQKLNLNALDVLVKHINDSSAFIQKEELLNHLSKIARSSEFEKSMGKIGQRWVAGWLDLLARGGVPKGYKPGPLTQLVRNIGHGVLGFRVSPIVKQPLAKIVSVGHLGADAFIHDPQFYANPGIRDAIHKISKQQAFRNFDDPVYTARAKSKRLAKWQEWGYKGIKTFDSWTADSVWYAAYRKNIKDRGLDFNFNLDEFIAGKNIDNEAKEYSDLIVRRTQGSSEYKDAPLLYASQSNKDLVMAFLQFQRFIHNQSILWRDAKVALAKEKDPIKAAAIASSLIAAGIAESYITTGIAQLFSSENYAKKEREKEIGDRVFNTIAGQIPVISNLTSIAEYGGTGVPVWDVSRQGYLGAVSAFTAKKPETKIKGAIKAGETAASLGGISGAGQVGQILRKFVPESESTFKQSGDTLKKYGIETTNTGANAILKKYGIPVR